MSAAAGLPPLPRARARRHLAVLPSPGLEFVSPGEIQRTHTRFLPFWKKKLPNTSGLPTVLQFCTTTTTTTLFFTNTGLCTNTQADTSVSRLSALKVMSVRDRCRTVQRTVPYTILCTRGVDASTVAGMAWKAGRRGSTLEERGCAKSRRTTGSPPPPSPCSRSRRLRFYAPSSSCLGGAGDRACEWRPSRPSPAPPG